jgi:hypothetical protein
MEIINYIILKTFLGIPYSLNSFQFFPNVFMIHQKYCYKFIQKF